MFRTAASALYEYAEAEAFACVVCEDLYGVSRLDIALDPSADVCIGEGVPDPQAVVEMIGSGCPAQYITGVAHFCGMRLAVGRGVLIPRPETEELVERVAEFVRNEMCGGCTPMYGGSVRGGSEKMADSRVGADVVRILDVGTGSGAIAIALAARFGDRVSVTAVDVSEEALEMARRNAEKQRVEVEFLQVDALRGVTEWAQAERWTEGGFDVVVSNPPYIPQSDIAEMRSNVTEYEPHLALFVGDDDPLVFYRSIARHGRHLLRDGGALCFEIYERLAQELSGMLVEMGYADVSVHRDINDKERIIVCRKKS